MNILYYQWNENSSYDIMSVFEEFGYPFAEISYPLTNYDFDLVFEEQLEKLLSTHHFDLIFTFNYFPILSRIAAKHKLPYAAWVYDCPNLTLYSITIKNPCNFLFLFDRAMYETALSLGAVHAFHLPLAVNSARLNQQLSLPGQITSGHFLHDVSFIGSLYEQNMYRRISYLPEYIRGYLNGLMNAQQKVWGCNLIEELLSDELILEMRKYICLDETSNYTFSAKNIFLNMLDSHTTYLERSRLLQMISNQFRTDIYSGSPLLEINGCMPHEFISYTNEMPNIFCGSKINLNITLRSIRQGIPLRCLDIMGAGGFLLTNYQAELWDYFVPDEDFAVYESDEDMMNKISYYLHHPAKQMEIAQNGWNIIQTNFTYSVQFQRLIREIPSALL